MYEKTVAFQLWIKRTGDSIERQALQNEMILPISQKTYKVTLKNVKVFVEELMQSDPIITEIQIDRIASVGVVRRKETT